MDLEGRFRHNNIKIMGLPEGEEKGRPTEFVFELIPKLLGNDNFPNPLWPARIARRNQSQPTEPSHARLSHECIWPGNRRTLSILVGNGHKNTRDVAFSSTLIIQLT